MSANIFYMALTLFAGLTIPVMAALNSRLGVHYDSFAFAAVILFFVSLSAAAIVLVVTGIPKMPETQIASYYYLGGLSAALYILSITYVAPKFGVGNAVFFVLLGQIISSVIIDHFGAFGAAKIPISWERALGVVLMAAGVYLAKGAG